VKIKIFQILTIFLVIIFGVVLSPFGTAKAQTANYCFCQDNNTGYYSCIPSSNCLSIQGFSCPSQPLTQTACNDQVRSMNNNSQGNITTPGGAQTESSGGLVSKILPPCVLKNTLDDNCKDVTIFLILMFQIINYLFGIIGGVALLFFVYGGFVFILSEGSPDKVAKGKGIIVAAIMGIIISFSGYALVKFVGKVAGIEDQYKLK
jgi:hypothetical protein